MLKKTSVLVLFLIVSMAIGGCSSWGATDSTEVRGHLTQINLEEAD